MCRGASKPGMVRMNKNNPIALITIYLIRGLMVYVIYRLVTDMGWLLFAPADLLEKIILGAIIASTILCFIATIFRHKVGHLILCAYIIVIPAILWIILDSLIFHGKWWEFILVFPTVQMGPEFLITFCIFKSQSMRAYFCYQAQPADNK